MLSSFRWNTGEGNHRRGMSDSFKFGAQQQRRSATATATSIIKEEAQTAEEITELFEIALKLRLTLLPQICHSEGSLWWQQRIPAKSFSGAEAARKMISAGFVANQEDAVRLGNRLLLIGALCGTAVPTVFFPYDYSLYRFSVDRYALLAGRTEGARLMDGTRIGGVMVGLSFRTMAELSLRMRDANTGVVSVADDAGVRTFCGKDAVDWLLRAGVAATREDSVSIAGALVREGVFSDAEEKCNFRDEMARYVFAKDRFGVALRAAFTSGLGKREGLKGKRGYQAMTVDAVLSLANVNSIDATERITCPTFSYASAGTDSPCCDF